MELTLELQAETGYFYELQDIWPVIKQIDAAPVMRAAITVLHRESFQSFRTTRIPICLLGC